MAPQSYRDFLIPEFVNIILHGKIVDITLSYLKKKSLKT